MAKKNSKTRPVRKTKKLGARAARDTGAAPAGRTGKRASKKRAGKRSTKASGRVSKTRGRPAAAGATGRPGRPPLQPVAETNRLMERVTKFLSKNPDSRLEEIGTALGANTKDLKRPIFLLLEEGRLSTAGQRRGMRYRLR
jgi:hypothetical protein